MVKNGSWKEHHPLLHLGLLGVKKGWEILPSTIVIQQLFFNLFLLVCIDEQNKLEIIIKDNHITWNIFGENVIKHYGWIPGP
jgi:hypothetical protein